MKARDMQTLIKWMQKNHILHTTLFTLANDSGVLETGCLQ